jgi:hypothetical protein
VRKISVITVLIILISLVLGFFLWEKNLKKHREHFNKDITKISEQKNDTNDTKTIVTISDSLRKKPVSKILGQYYNNLGITFIYPANWIKTGPESNSVNAAGDVLSSLVSFKDSLNKTILSIEYHASPFGEKLYETYRKAFENSNLVKQKIKVAGQSALKTSFIRSSDIKGNRYNPPIQVLQIAFIGKNGKGEYTIRFETPNPKRDKQVKIFNQVISTMKFVDNSTNH